jgi:hypothetical protein
VVGVALSATLALLAPACGGLSEPEATASAAVKCAAFVEHYCTQYAECVDATDAQVVQCQRDVDELLDCSRALAVSDQYSTCWAQISDNDCAALTQAVPSACNDVIVVPSAEADCDELTGEFCDELVGCGAYESVGACAEVAGTALDCSTAVETTANFTACLSALGGRSCADVEAGLPPVCAGVVLTE